MRPLATWLVIGALALIGLFAAVDALRGDDAPASAPTTTLAKLLRRPPAQAPRIVNRDRLAAAFSSFGQRNVECLRRRLRVVEEKLEKIAHAIE